VGAARRRRLLRPFPQVLSKQRPTSSHPEIHRASRSLSRRAAKYIRSFGGRYPPLVSNSQTAIPKRGQPSSRRAGNLALWRGRGRRQSRGVPVTPALMGAEPRPPGLPGAITVCPANYAGLMSGSISGCSGSPYAIAAISTMPQAPSTTSASEINAKKSTARITVSP
jgi:hypothetical protein